MLVAQPHLHGDGVQGLAALSGESLVAAARHARRDRGGHDRPREALRLEGSDSLGSKCCDPRGRDAGPETTMTPKNTYGWIRLLTLFRLVVAVACESDLTSPGRQSKPEFVLLTPGTFSQVSAGGYHTCALQTDGTVACWGSNGSGEATPPSGSFTQVSAGGGHTCGLKADGTIACWGRNDYGQATPPTETFTQVSARGLHTCGLASDGTVACWGWNGFGEATPPAGTFTQVSAGWEVNCGLKTDGSVACEGNN